MNQKELIKYFESIGFTFTQTEKGETGDLIKQLEKDLAGVSSMVVQTGCLMCVCSYLQPHTKQRNYKNILVKQDRFPTIQECQAELEKDLGFLVEDVVLMNWKEVNNNYEL